MKPLRLKGELGLEVHANDYYLKIPTLDSRELTDFLEGYEGIVVSIKVVPILSICPKCGRRTKHVNTMWICPSGDFSCYEDEDGSLKFV